MTQKQTVYLPVNDDSETVIICEDIGKLEKINGYFFTPEQLNEYTQNVIKQALEAAAEKIVSDALERFGSDVPDCWSINSITNTFEETFNKLKV